MENSTPSRLHGDVTAQPAAGGRECCGGTWGSISPTACPGTASLCPLLALPWEMQVKNAQLLLKKLHIWVPQAGLEKSLSPCHGVCGVVLLGNITAAQSRAAAAWDLLSGSISFLWH